MRSDELGGSGLGTGVAVATVLGAMYWVLVVASVSGLVDRPGWFTALMALVVGPVMIAAMMVVVAGAAVRGTRR